jgi:hypothetical protein
LIRENGEEVYEVMVESSKINNRISIQHTADSNITGNWGWVKGNEFRGMFSC